MEELVEKFRFKLSHTSTDFVRSLGNDINWNARLIGVKGARGVGKTTMLLQHIKMNLTEVLDKTLYVSLDSIWFSNNTLVDLADDFVKKGGEYLFLDEVHRYDNWSQELKNIYDDYPMLKVVFTGSSLLQILNARADLSRRAITYTMQGLSFREYLSIETGQHFDKLTLESILSNHSTESALITAKVKPLQYFDRYLRQGYYPFYKEELDLYIPRLEEVINMMLEIELPLLRGLDLAYVHKIKQLLLIISESVPFVPNVSKLSDKIGIARSTLLLYFHYLAEIGLTVNLFKESGGISKLQKPLKVYLENSNLMYALTSSAANTGNIRETFFANQLGYTHKIMYSDRGDFFVDEKYVFEIGGKDKSKKQIEGVENSFIASDDIEYGFQNKIPLWLFGFLY
ncbi:ATP-binding protein [Flavobacterium laiguense]|uniref:AAA family ATPase n=1 Tax=Flavobacterium laiguense TaxID=2169409 RepID=A0A2U1JY94_9FLAO|nr:AAA family ATPase [Flavobacterium laiguense]PWA09929.1 AAA family ATPase [Flavobacterium laiguense]